MDAFFVFLVFLADDTKAELLSMWEPVRVRKERWLELKREAGPKPIPDQVPGYLFCSPTSEKGQIYFFDKMSRYVDTAIKLPCQMTEDQHILAQYNYSHCGMCRGRKPQKRCAACRLPYCGVQCQIKDRERHSQHCRFLESSQRLLQAKGVAERDVIFVIENSQGKMLAAFLPRDGSNIQELSLLLS